MSSRNALATEDHDNQPHDGSTDYEPLFNIVHCLSLLKPIQVYVGFAGAADRDDTRPMVFDNLNGPPASPAGGPSADVKSRGETTMVSDLHCSQKWSRDTLSHSNQVGLPIWRSKLCRPH